MLQFARSSDAEEFIVATETGMLHPLERENPGKRFIAANRAAVCRYMKKMITLPKLRDSLRDLKPRVSVDPAIAERPACRSSTWWRSVRRRRAPGLVDGEASVRG